MTTYRTPVVPGVDHVDPTIRRAYWDAVTLLDAGWQLRKLRFDSFARTAAIDLHTPTHRAVTIHSTGIAPALPFAETARAFRLACAVASLGQRGGDDLGDLQWQLTEHIRSTSLNPLARRDRIPDPNLIANRDHQPVNFRTAFWQLATLVADYGWHVSNIGDEIAGGGFIADIPNDLTAVFPASMADDGTTAAQLAQRIQKLDRRSLDYLRRATPTTLAAARRIIGA
ncbi:hypothetical protein [Mycolicibacterium llatzerense]|uniref:hypothetical protein n=1 Tax=Mycolicibacterium llatzerense TaxID=280871 RepID=UPI0021B5DF2E|nr:hypothetical protein [Mycolicibacterium llatzerense]MCT7373008.1 hypothetical protein [Mycolicibacterium llatzerense]